MRSKVSEPTDKILFSTHIIIETKTLNAMTSRELFNTRKKKFLFQELSYSRIERTLVLK